MNVFIHKYIFLFLQTPTSNEQWGKIAEEFHRRWNFPHCVDDILMRNTSTSSPQSTMEAIILIIRAITPLFL